MDKKSRLTPQLRKLKTNNKNQGAFYSDAAFDIVVVVVVVDNIDLCLAHWRRRLHPRRSRPPGRPGSAGASSAPFADLAADGLAGLCTGEFVWRI